MIPVVFITDNNFIMQTGVAITSLVNNRDEGTEYDVFVVSAECSKEARTSLERLQQDGVRINVVEASLDMYRDIRQLAHIPIACLLKFNICDLVTEYDKLIYLDGDIYVRGDLTQLYEFELGDAYIAGVPSLDMLMSDRTLVNAGILLFNAKKMRDDKMSEVLVEKRRSLGDRGSMDQQTFNIVMQGRMGMLPFQYNCIPDKILGNERKINTIDKLNKLYDTSYKTSKELVADGVIIHYATGTKPWKYSFVPCGDEWYQCYRNSCFADVPIKRLGRMEAHLVGIRRQFKNGGFKGILKRIGSYARMFAGKGDKNVWG